MILDTTYLLPLARIAIDTDLLAAMARKEVDLEFGDLAVSLISVFELQAKAAKLKVPAESAVKAIEAVLAAFRVEPFHKTEIVEASYELRKTISDYIDCVILATAIASKEDLLTEDSLMLSAADAISKKYKTRVLSLRDMAKPDREN